MIILSFGFQDIVSKIIILGYIYYNMLLCMLSDVNCSNKLCGV